VLTGDKVETAVNIGYATALLRPEMEPLIRIVRAPPPHPESKVNNGQKSTIAKRVPRTRRVLRMTRESRSLHRFSGGLTAPLPRYGQVRDDVMELPEGWEHYAGPLEISLDKARRACRAGDVRGLMDVAREAQARSARPGALLYVVAWLCDRSHRARPSLCKAVLLSVKLLFAQAEMEDDEDAEDARVVFAMVEQVGPRALYNPLYILRFTYCALHASPVPTGPSAAPRAAASSARRGVRWPRSSTHGSGE